jgi:hypothetical protein
MPPSAPSLRSGWRSRWVAPLSPAPHNQNRTRGRAYFDCANGGEGEIRTHEPRKGPPVFKTGAFNRSATSPKSLKSTTCLIFGTSFCPISGVNVSILFPLCPINLANASPARMDAGALAGESGVQGPVAVTRGRRDRGWLGALRFNIAQSIPLITPRFPKAEPWVALSSIRTIRIIGGASNQGSRTQWLR